MSPEGASNRGSALERAEPAAHGIDSARLDLLCRTIETHIEQGRYPGAQVALARHGKLLLDKTFGRARLVPAPVPARDDTLWLLYSNTKVIVACAIWVLVEDGALTFHDRIADHMPEFAANGKSEITLFQVLSHQAGYPGAPNPPMAAWTDRDLLRRTVCGYALEWEPGTRLEYHRTAAHWTCAALIEAVTGGDFRDFVRNRVIAPLGLGQELYVGIPESQHARVAHMYGPGAGGSGQTLLEGENEAAFWRAGAPGHGGYGTARAMAAFYAMLGNGGSLNGARIVSPRMVQYVTCNFTGDRVDQFMRMPMNRGLGPHSRGKQPAVRGLGSIASPATFGHGGVGSSYCWHDPESGVSFAYLSNSRVPDPWHSRRMDVVSGLAHAAIEIDR